MDESTRYKITAGINYPDGTGGEKRLEPGTTLDLAALPEKEQAALKVALPWLVEQGVLMLLVADEEDSGGNITESNDRGAGQGQG